MARTPKYQTATAEMARRISTGTWEVGLRLPNEFQLADEFGVSQGTMRRALIALEDQGLLNRKPGRGTVVAAKTATQKKAVLPTPVLRSPDGSALVLAPFRGRSGTRVASHAEAETMGDARVSYLERTLKHGKARAALEATAVPETLVASLEEDAPADLAGLLDHHGLNAARITVEACAELTDMGQSVALSVDRHTPLLVLRSAAYGAEGQVIARQILRIATEGARLAPQ